MAKQRSKPTKAGKLRSYGSYVSNARMKINRDNIGSKFAGKRIDPITNKEYEIVVLNTKQMQKKQIKDMNKLQGGEAKNKNIRSYMKKKNWKYVRIGEKSSYSQVRRALKNQKIYLEGKVRAEWISHKKSGGKRTLKDFRTIQDARRQEYEGVGGSW
jgi:hypothetical protein